MSKTVVQKTIIISLIVQFISTVVTWEGFYENLKRSDLVLQEILLAENIVQVIEFSFYVWISYTSHKPVDITPRRYIDWVITTPTMLLSTMVFMKYNTSKRKGEIISYKTFLSTNGRKIVKIMINNFFMLLCGFLAEIGVIDLQLGVLIGFIFFYMTFSNLYEFVENNTENENLFRFLVSVWGLYGFAALLDVHTKNVSYNMLDLVAKNFYGLFIFYKIKEISMSNNREN
jgi:bacteriorhodopsin